MCKSCGSCGHELQIGEYRVNVKESGKHSEWSYTRCESCFVQQLKDKAIKGGEVFIDLIESE